MKQLIVTLVIFVLVGLKPVHADEFQILDIRIEGLQRVSAGTVFAALPVSVGDVVDESTIRDATRSIFRTGYFADVIMARENGILVVGLVERPAVTEINIDGNKAIETDQLMDALRDNGLAEGQIFRQVILEGMGQELQRQYVSQGRYGALVETEVTPLPRNRIAVDINIDEGDVAKIRHINIVGNKTFSEQELLDGFEQNKTGWLSWITSDDKYSREKLSGDLETLESWYLDRGYLNFQVSSTQVSVSPNKESVYITINIDEGDVYRISEIELAGELIIPEKQVRGLVLLREDAVFSQILMTTTSEYISKRLGNEGYTFAEVDGFPEVDEETKTAKVTFLVKPGMRAYVRRIDFRGNTKTADEVLRREMRQMESASANNALIELSKVRLERIGFFKEVNVETIPVPGKNDQIDVVYTVEEQPSGSVGANLGYSQGYGLMLGANLTENNFLGSGKQVGVGINKSTYQSSINFSYTEPYFTTDGVSAGYSVYVRETDYSKLQLQPFSQDTSGASVNWSYPLSEVQRIGFGFGYEYLELDLGDYSTSEVIEDFVENNGNWFKSVSANVNWVKSTLNRGIFATRGTSQRLGLDVMMPGSGLEYYKVSYKATHLRGLTNNFTLKLKADLGYGESYGDTSQMPFFKNFYSGGLGSVRGYKRYSLGPQNSVSSGFGRARPIGGNVQIVLGAEVIFPLPFVKDQRSVQSALFFDAGNVFNTKCNDLEVNCFSPKDGELRYSVGLGATWLSGFGPITFSIAKPLNSEDYDETEVFQFSLGNQF
ncbi:outer membrane protein assembly factor BamA [Porticoccaceae bacterium]|nr:outer membrane protein assembly factor BamA [Porticoccaceae bacterium]MDB2343900.1 outer membrane protein assembly factor BamA [Porticoccaceae bacterium]MDB2634458.1 outer membrane protein assembly factor BamA [Porticoccaceae bacterium]